MITGICTAGELADALAKFCRDTRISAFEITFTVPDEPHELTWDPR